MLSVNGSRIIEPTYAPVSLRESVVGGASAEEPRIRALTATYLVTAAAGFAVIPITVGSPTLIKVHGLSFPAEASLIRCEWEGYWRRRGVGRSYDLSSIPLQALPFAGPYAYLTESGEYEIILHTTCNPTNVIASYQLQVTNGLDYRSAELLLDPARSYRAFFDRVILAPGAEAAISPDLLPSHKRLLLRNSGPSSMEIKVGVAGAIVASLAGGGFALPFELNPDFLGRGTVSVTAPGSNTAFGYTLSQW